MVSVISYSVCPWQAFPAWSSIYEQTLRLITEITAVICFMIQAPGENHRIAPEDLTNEPLHYITLKCRCNLKLKGLY
jgi:hypothetical protein